MGSDPITITAALITVAGALQEWQLWTVLAVFVVIPIGLSLYGLHQMAAILTGLKGEIVETRAETKQIMTGFINRYDKNIEVILRMQKLADDLSSIVSMNTQAMTSLVERIKMMGR